MIYNNAIEMVGNTPLLKVQGFDQDNRAEVFIKLEKFNPAGSVKDRAALGMLEDAEKAGILKEGSIIVEPTSGNTGIALAMLGKVKGYRVIIVMPETMSMERRSLITSYGAELILTDGATGMKGAIKKAEEIKAELGEMAFIPQQFINPSNLNKHFETTAEEIFRDLPIIDAFVAGVGTGGTITGFGQYAKKNNKTVKIFAVEPSTSAVLSGDKPGAHKIQGIGAGFVPEVLNTEIYDEIIRVENEDAFDYGKVIAIEEGILVGISSGAALYAAIQVAKRKENKGKTIVAFLPDNGDRYLSTPLFS